MKITTGEKWKTKLTSNVLDAGLDQSLGLLLGNLVLGSTGKGDIGLVKQSPRSGTLVVGESTLDLRGRLVEVLKGLVLELEGTDGVDVGGGEAFSGGEKGTLGVGKGEDVTSKFDDLNPASE